MWTIGYIHYITNKIAYITYSHVDQDIPYLLKCDKGLFHAWDIIAVGLQEHIYNGIANYDIIDIIKIQNFDISLYVVLCNKEHKLHIKFGYDYYLNVSCSLNCETLKNIVCREGLYLDPR